MLAVDRMLRGKPVDMTWSRVVVSVFVQDPLALASALVDLNRGSLRYVGVRIEEIFGHQIALRDIATDLFSARVANQAKLEAQLPFQPGTTLQVVLEPANTDEGRLHILDTT